MVAISLCLFLATSVVIALILMISSFAAGKEVVKLADILGFKEHYYVGDELEVDGTVRATYGDGRVEVVPITEDMVEGFDSSEPGKIDITITYKEGSVAVPIVFSPLKVRTLTMDETTVPSVVYKGVPFPAGLYVVAEMIDDSVNRVPVTVDMMRGFDGLTLGEQKVTVYYMNAYVSFTVEVVEDEIDSVELSTEKTVYAVGESIALDSITLTIRNKSGLTRRVKAVESMIEGEFDSSTVGERTLLVKYGSFSAEYRYTVA